MKRLFLLLTLALVVMSCEQVQDFIDTKGHELVFLEGEMKAYFDDKGDTKNYKFIADLAWSAEASADWVVVNPTSGEAGENKIQIKVDKNNSTERRTGYVDIILSNEQSYRIELEQSAAGENLDDVTPPVSIPSNEIWYTSTDGKIVEPYSGEYNGDADAITTFGVNIVSNTYADGKGVIEFDGDVTTIGDYAFLFCNTITTLSFAKSVTTIGDCAFSGCSSLTSITWGKGVKTVGSAAFNNCTSLNAVYISDLAAWCNIDFIVYNGKENPLCYAHNLYLDEELVTDLVIPESITAIKQLAFFNCGSIKNLTIHDNLTSIGQYAFQNCDGMESVTIGESVTEIGVQAFSWCESLTSVTIPDSVTEIGAAAFAYCSSLQEFNGKFASEDGKCLIIDGTLNSFAPAGLTEYTILNSVTSIGDAAFADCRSLTSITIPDSVISIGSNVFQSCGSLTSVTIPDSVTAIGYAAFAYCDSLTSVTIGDSVTTIGDLAFYSCTSLTSVTIPDSATTIGEYAFCGCASLSSIVIGSNVQAIGLCAFSGCFSLTEIYCKSITPPAVVSWMFEQNSELVIYVPTESVEAYKSTSYWSIYASAIVGYDF